MSDETPEARERKLVTKIQITILNASNKEDKFNELLKRYLCPLLLKATSEQAAVRNDVIQFAGKLKTLIMHPSIVLPVGDLLDQYRNKPSPILRVLDMSFVQHSIGRLEDYERRSLVSKVTQGISSPSQGPTQPSMFNVLLKIIPDVQVPSRGSEEDVVFRKASGLDDDADAAFVAKWLGKVLLLKIPGGSNPSRQDYERVNPALTAEDLDFLKPDQRDTASAFQRMQELRRKIAQLLASGAFKDEERLLPTLSAAASPDYQVSQIGEDILKRMTIDFEKKEIVDELYNAHARLPAPHRIRILSLLTRSTLATTMHDRIRNVVTLDFGTETTSTAPSHLQSAAGLERNKLHRVLFHFINWTATAVTDTPFTIGPELVDKMRTFVEDQGWPTPRTLSSDEETLRAMAYDLLGTLGMSSPISAQDKLSLVGWLFRSLSEDPTSELVVNIESSLSGLTRSFDPKTVSGQGRGSGSGMVNLLSLLLHYMNLPEEPPAVRSVRFSAVKWANRTVASWDERGRWIDILAIAGRQGERTEVVEEGRKGLDPWTYRDDGEEHKMPDWRKLMVYFFCDKITDDFASDDRNGTNPQKHILDSDDAAIAQNFSGEKVYAYPVAVEYVKRAMFVAALPDFALGPNWAEQLDTQVRNDTKTRERIRAYLRSVDESHVALLIKICFDGVRLRRKEGANPIVESCLRSFVDIASVSPAGPISRVATHAHLLQESTRNNNRHVRLLAAQASGILVPHPLNEVDLNIPEATPQLRRNQQIQDFLRNLKSMIFAWETSAGTHANAVEGALQAFGHIFSRAAFYGHPIPADVHLPPKLLMDKSNHGPSLEEAILDCYSQLWTASLSQYIPDNVNNLTADYVIERLGGKAAAGSDRAILSLGRLALAFNEPNEEPTPEDGLLFPNSKTSGIDNILRVLFGLHTRREIEIQFTVGEAITAAIACWDSDHVKLTMNVDGPDGPWRKTKRSRRVTAVLDKLFQDCKTTKPSLLKGSGIWLFCVVQHCGHLDEVQSRLREAQAAFMRLLSARDELVQETASRGLSLVYEKGDEGLKQDLVKDLVSAFTGNSTQIKVENETELFEPGALPTGEGKSVTSYKDIVSLANEVGDQSLVYKFMSLATNAATWSTRSAFGRFGLSNILSESEVDPKLYPKLYRYRFDPNSNVQRSMDDIWKALVKNPNETIGEHFDEIMQDLLKNILGKEWRVRQASCGAISDLISGQPFDKYDEYYPQIWTAALKVLDDVKGSVREAALKLCMGLTNNIVRQLEEGGQSSSAQAMLQQALRFLFSPSGLDNNAEEVKMFSLKTIIDITKKGGANLRPFIVDFVPPLLGLHSTIEPEQINYAYQKVGEDSREQIDKLRARLVNQSPITDAVDNCLRQLDEASMKDLAPKIEDMIKTAIGMPTKIACARLLGDLVVRHAVVFAPYAPRFLQVMEKQALDRNDEVAKGYARAAGYLVRVVPEAAKERLAEKMVELYFSSEDEARRAKVADVVLGVSKLAPDHFNRLSAQFIPFTYLGLHDMDAYTRQAFDEVWSQHGCSSRTVARYVPEVVGFVKRGLEAPRWNLQHTAAFTIADAVKAVVTSSDTGAISEANLKAVWPILDKALALKTFPGKEKLLVSYPQFVGKGRVLWQKDAAIAAQQVKIALREAKRNNEDYRPHAYKMLWKFAEQRDDRDMLEDIATIAGGALDDLLDEDRMDVDASADKTRQAAVNGVEAIAKGFNRSQMDKNPAAVVERVFELLKPYITNAKFDAVRREVWYESVKYLMEIAAGAAEKAEAAPPARKEVALKYLESLDVDAGDVGTEAQRTSRAKAIGGVLKAVRQGVFESAGDTHAVVALVKKVLDGERSLEVQKILKDVLASLE
ncbi:Proteasome component ECM29 [Colletotrichum orbiculare MAFF 240422]|uniref:Proteasome component ECM29 n=1 Tax=Colletotrichum orbiculare (strain 104-T / ATCC 96160 / CBS 514.97 / LARS 414 / MAFF 240422) TaxID=1213857 RepID=N4VL22_COLOR|nr:Proteasome component ECM29 [Colletotrichum orbiculare MAFF 240422]